MMDLFSGCYLLKKEEYVKRYGRVTEMELFHATCSSNVSSITRNNFDWRRTMRARFGIGVSFSPDAHYANAYSNRNNPSRRAMLIAKVLVGSTCNGYDFMKLPGSVDTSTGNSGKVYVKYSDNEFYPAYVAYYDNPGTRG
jgi:poly [ADP-ribose] polymerase 7/11/12/13